MRRSDMGKGATLRQGSKGPKLKLAGTAHRAQEVTHADLHQEIWGLSPTAIPHRAPPHTHTYQGLYLTSWVPKCHCPAAKGTETLGSSLTSQTNPLTHSCIIH